MGELKRSGQGQNCLPKNDMVESDEGEEMNPMEQVSNNGEIFLPAELYFGLKNNAERKCPNA